MLNPSPVVGIQNMTTDNQQDKLLALILAVQRADQDAFSQLYDSLVSKVCSLDYRMMSNSEDAEEVVCDSFTQIWQQAKNYRPEKAMLLHGDHPQPRFGSFT